jgi:hypothetical protein
MMEEDYKVLFAALGFTAVVMQGEIIRKKDGALRAATFAELIEKFCRTSVPEAFAAKGGEGQAETALELAGRMADAIAEIMKAQGGCLPHDLIIKGFTLEEIDRHWTMARALAAVKLNITDA